MGFEPLNNLKIICNTFNYENNCHIFNRGYYGFYSTRNRSQNKTSP